MRPLCATFVAPALHRRQPRSANARLSCKRRVLLSPSRAPTRPAGALLARGSETVRAGNDASAAPSRTRDQQPVLLVSDLDNTLVDHTTAVGSDPALAAFRNAWERQLAPRGSTLVYSTGRSLALFAELQRAHRDLPTPDYLVCAVGTLIYDFARVKRTGDVSDATPDEDFARRLSAGYDRAAIERAAQPYVDAGVLRLQPPSEMNAHKVSYNVAVADAARVRNDVVPALRDALQRGTSRAPGADTGLRVKMVLSSDSSGAYLDLLSQCAGKGASLAYLRRRLGVSPEQCVVCGDSGNDIDLFFGDVEDGTGDGERDGAPASDTASIGSGGSGALGIAVANARPELLDAFAADARPEHFVARERCAAGVVDGLRHFGFLPASGA